MSNEYEVKDVVDEKDAQKEDLKEPSMWNVILWNDDYTPMDFVIGVLMDYFGYDMVSAGDIMMQVHKNGKAIAGKYPHDIAETKMFQVLATAKQEGHPLMASIEKEDE